MVWRITCCCDKRACCQLGTTAEPSSLSLHKCCPVSSAARTCPPNGTQAWAQERIPARSSHGQSNYSALALGKPLRAESRAPRRVQAPDKLNPGVQTFAESLLTSSRRPLLRTCGGTASVRISGCPSAHRRLEHGRGNPSGFVQPKQKHHRQFGQAPTCQSWAPHSQRQRCLHVNAAAVMAGH